MRVLLITAHDPTSNPTPLYNPLNGPKMEPVWNPSNGPYLDVTKPCKPIFTLSNIEAV